MKQKLFGIFITIILLLGISTVVSYAGINVNSATVNSGENVTISVTSSEALGCFKIVVTDNAGMTLVRSSGAEGAVANGNQIAGMSTSGVTSLGSYTFKVPEVTEDKTYKVVISGSGMADVNENDIPGSSATSVITVKAPVKQDPPANTTPQNQTPAQQPTNNTPAQQPANNTPAQQQKQEPQVTYQAVNDTIYTANGTINIRSGPSTSYSVVGSLAKDQPLTRTGIGSNGWDKVIVNGSVAYINHALITTAKPEEEPKEEEKSVNKSLKELKVEGYEIEPAFNPETTKYTINLKEDEAEDSLKLTATAEDEKATVNVEGNENFTPGNNMVKITVTAEDGTTRIYTITVVKSTKTTTGDELRLATLEISNGTLEPAFSPEITNYIIHIEDPSVIKAQNFVATPADEDVTVTNAENTLSDDGEKVIVFMLQSKDGSKNGTYQITVKKPAAKVESMVKKDNDKTIYYILGGTIAVLIVLIIIIIVALKKTADSDDDEDYEDEEEEYSNNSTSNYNSNTTNNFDYSLKNAIDEANSDIDDDEIEADNFKFTSQALNKKVKNFDMDEEVNDGSESSMDKTRAFKFEPNSSEDNEDIEFSEKKKGKHF